MKTEHKSLETRLQQFVQDCKRLGLKATHQRIEIFREVVQTDEHPDAERVFEGVRMRIPTISRNTVYSTLQRLFDHGLITTLGIHFDRRRFDGNTDPHHHLVCTSCGKVQDIDSMEYPEPAAPREFGNWGIIRSAQVELRGICSDCLGLVSRHT